MKIYDCFLFFDELELLKLRLNELDYFIDKFVIVESTKTFSGKVKPLVYLKNKRKFQKFSDKIIHVVVRDTPNLPPNPKWGHNRHEIQYFQRNCIHRGLTNCDPSDLILISDADEIPSREGILEAKKLSSQQKYVGFQQLLFFYYLNGLCIQNDRAVVWIGTAGCRFRHFHSAQSLRDNRGKKEKKMVKNGGWHFSFLGGVDRIVKKIESYNHAEFDNLYFKDKSRIQNCLDEGKDLFERPGRPNQIYAQIDKMYPEYLQKHTKNFQHLIRS